MEKFNLTSMNSKIAALNNKLKKVVEEKVEPEVVEDHPTSAPETKELPADTVLNFISINSTVFLPGSIISSGKRVQNDLKDNFKDKISAPKLDPQQMKSRIK